MLVLIVVSTLIYLAIGLRFAMETWSHVLDHVKEFDDSDKEMYEKYRLFIIIPCWTIYMVTWPIMLLLIIKHSLTKKKPVETEHGEEPNT